MATATEGPGTGMLNLERELVCFICTEILFQPLTLLDCLHTFCGSCLQGWFSHQHRTASHRNHSSSSVNPYTCPTCRAQVKDARPNAMVNTWLELFLTANPTRDRSEEDKDEQRAMYKPGDNILLKVEPSRRRERRSRREEEELQERRMIEAAREESLREAGVEPESHREHLQLPTPPRGNQTSRSRDRERDERRQRRREREEERRLRRQDTESAMADGHGDVRAQEERRSTSSPSSPPESSPRHPEAVEARSRQQTVVHQASLVSLISTSESGTNSSTGDGLDNARIMQEIIDSGLLAGIDIDSLTEAQQDMWAERIAQEYRRRIQAEQQRSPPTEHTAAVTSPSTELYSAPPAARNVPQQQQQQQQQHHHHHRRRSASATTSGRRPDGVTTIRSEDTDRPRSSRTRAAEISNGQIPPAAMNTQRRRRHSNQSQSGVSSRVRSRPSSPTNRSARSESRSAADIGHLPRTADLSFAERVARPAAVSRTSTEPRSSPPASEIHLPTTDVLQHPPAPENDPPPPPPPLSTDDIAPAVSSPRGSVAELPASQPQSPRPASRSMSASWQAPIRYEEPSVSCFRCQNADIQYDVYKHCERCKVDLCLRCYRTGRGCNHWYGFGHAAMAKFDSMNTGRRDSEQVELPHLLVGRSMRKPHQSLVLESKLAKDGRTSIPLKTMSDPAKRVQEGHFCDRCGALANSCFWSCDRCNDGEWGFCRDCVNTHHCCTHPLLPIAQKSLAPNSSQNQTSADGTTSLGPNELHSAAATLSLSPRPSQPSSATSAVSHMAGPLLGYVNLDIKTHCDICSQAIPLTYLRYHCPSHPSPGPGNTSSKGDYDLCTPCYHNLVKTNRVKRDDGPAGWRKCPSGHRMIMTKFEADGDGGYRRIVNNDMVGGWKMTEAAMHSWMQAMIQGHTSHHVGGNDGTAASPTSNPTWSWREDTATGRRQTRTRAISILGGSSSPTTSQATTSLQNNSSPASPTNQASNKFPPDSGFGARGYASWSFYPEEGEEGKDTLMFPRGAEVREINDVNGDWWEGVYAGDIGFGPAGYVRF